MLKEVVEQQGSSKWFKVLQIRQATVNVQTICFSYAVIKC
jgi:hypothetical protein